MKYRLLFTLVVLSAMLVFSACAMPAATPDAAGDVAVEDAQVTITYWSDPRFQFVIGLEDQTQQIGDYEQLLADRFMEMHPNVTIQVQALQWEELTTRVAAAIAAGSPPDVLKDYLGRTSAYANQGLLEPLQDAIPAEEYNDYLPSLIDQYTINGDLHGLPLFFWVTHMYGNRAIFEQQGATDLLPDHDTGQWSVDQFEQALAALAVDDALWPLGFQVASEQADYNVLGFFWSMGATLYEDGDYTQSALNSPAGVAALEKLVEWYENGYVIPGVTTISNNDLSNSLYQGQTAILGGGLSNIAAARTAEQEGRLVVDWDPFIAVYPQAEGVQSGGMAAGPTGAVVFKQTDEAKRYWAIEFARYLANPENQLEYAVNSNQFPSRSSVPNPFEGNPDFERVNAWIQTHGVEDMGLSSPTYAEVRVLLQPQLQAALLGQKTPAEALADYERNANAILSRNAD